MIRATRFAIAAAAASLSFAAAAVTPIDLANPTWVLFDLQKADLAAGVTTVSFSFTTTASETDLQLSLVDLGVIGDMISATLDNAATPFVTTSSVSPDNSLTPAQFALANTTGTAAAVNIGTRRAPNVIPCDYVNLAGSYSNLDGQCASAARTALFSNVNQGFVVRHSGLHTLTLALTQTDLVNGLPQGSYGLMCLHRDSGSGCVSTMPVPEPASASLALAGLAALGALVRRRRTAA